MIFNIVLLQSNVSGKTGFSLTTLEGGFSDKVNDVFGSLDALETKHFAKERAKEKFGSKSVRNQLDSMCDYDSVQLPNPPPPSQHDSRVKNIDGMQRPPSRPAFRRPCARAPRQKHLPDYKVHPDRWMSYDLSTVSSSDISERSNSAAAHDFLSLRQQHREQEGSKKVVSSEDSKVVFKKPVNLSQERENSSKFVDGKFQMPEYVVGKNRDKKVKNISTHVAADSSKVSLGFKYVDTEEDEEGVKGLEGQSPGLIDVSSTTGSISPGNEESSPTTPAEVPVFKKSKKHGGTRRTRTVDQDDDD